MSGAPSVCSGEAYASVPRNWLVAVTGDVRAVDRLYATYAAVTPADVQAAARDFLTPSRRTVAALELLAAVVALGFSLLLLWRMWEGFLDYRKYVETTTILKIPIWVAYPWALASLALLAVAAAVSLRKAARGI